MNNTCSGCLDSMLYKHMSVPLSGRAPFCELGRRLWANNDSVRALFNTWVYSLYSTLSNVMGLNPSDVGGILGLGIRLVMPLCHSVEYVLNA